MTTELGFNSAVPRKPATFRTDPRAPEQCRPTRYWLLSTFCLLAACATNEYGRRGDTVDVSNFPPDIQETYGVFANRCSRCHSLARPLSAGIKDPEHWVRYVRRMSLQPGSGIGPHNSGDILRFLLFYTDLQAGKHTDEGSESTDAIQESGAAAQEGSVEDEPSHSGTTAPDESPDASTMNSPTTDAAAVSSPSHETIPDVPTNENNALDPTLPAAETAEPTAEPGRQP